MKNINKFALVIASGLLLVATFGCSGSTPAATPSAGANATTGSPAASPTKAP
jgi:hypothetical protein